MKWLCCCFQYMQRKVKETRRTRKVDCRASSLRNHVSMQRRLEHIRLLSPQEVPSLLLQAPGVPKQKQRDKCTQTIAGLPLPYKIMIAAQRGLSQYLIFTYKRQASPWRTALTIERPNRSHTASEDSLLRDLDVQPCQVFFKCLSFSMPAYLPLFLFILFVYTAFDMQRLLIFPVDFRVECASSSMLSVLLSPSIWLGVFLTVWVIVHG